jgi:DNA-binding transcriptional LysR family regulator
MSQPTITFQIKSLEEAFGVKLFERDRQQVRLTAAGCAFREYAQTIMDTVDAAQDCLGGLHTRLRLRVACGPVGQFILLPAVIRMLASEFPDFELEVIELTTEQLMTRLPEGKVDALLMGGALPIKGMRFDPICKENLVAMISRQSKLATERELSVQELRHHSIIASRPKDCRFHQPFLHEMLAPFGITPRIIESPQSCSVQFAYAAAGEGIAITTDSMKVCTFPGLIAIPFKESLPEMQLGLTTIDANETAAMAIFRSVVMRCAALTLECRTEHYASHSPAHAQTPQPVVMRHDRLKAS